MLGIHFINQRLERFVTSALFCFLFSMSATSGEAKPQENSGDSGERSVRFCRQTLPLHTESVECHKRFREPLTALKALQSLRHLDLSSSSVTDLSSIVELKSLTHLDVSFTRVKRLDMLQKLTELSSLRVAGLSPKLYRDLKFESLSRLLGVRESSPKGDLIIKLLSHHNQLSLTVNLMPKVKLDLRRVLRRLKGEDLSRVHISRKPKSRKDQDALDQATETDEGMELSDGAFIVVHADLRQITFDFESSYVSSSPDLKVSAELCGRALFTDTLAIRCDQPLDVRRLRAFPFLRVLSLSHPSVKSLKRLPKLERLRILSLEETRISSISFLRQTQNLQELWLNRTRVTQLKPIASLSELRLLSLSHTAVHSLKPLKSLKNLKVLYADHTRVKSVKPLRGLERLEELRLSNTPLKTIKSLKTLKQLSVLDVQHTSVSSREYHDVQRLIEARRALHTESLRPKRAERYLVSMRARRDVHSPPVDPSDEDNEDNEDDGDDADDERENPNQNGSSNAVQAPRQLNATALNYIERYVRRRLSLRRCVDGLYDPTPPLDYTSDRYEDTYKDYQKNIEKLLKDEMKLTLALTVSDGFLKIKASDHSESAEKAQVSWLSESRSQRFMSCYAELFTPPDEESELIFASPIDLPDDSVVYVDVSISILLASATHRVGGVCYDEELGWLKACISTSRDVYQVFDPHNLDEGAEGSRAQKRGYQEELELSTLRLRDLDRLYRVIDTESSTGTSRLSELLYTQISFDVDLDGVKDRLVTISLRSYQRDSYRNVVLLVPNQDFNKVKVLGEFMSMMERPEFVKAYYNKPTQPQVFIFQAGGDGQSEEFHLGYDGERMTLVGIDGQGA